MKFSNKVVIVTGGGSGIGRATAELFANEGAKVAVIDIIGQRAEEVVHFINRFGGSALAIGADVSKKELVNLIASQVLEAYGQIDVLINNVAVGVGNDILEIDEETWYLNIDTTLKSVYLCSKAVLPSMISQQRGSIVNIGSVNGLAAFGNMAYSAAKAGVINLTKNMAVVYGKHNIRVNVICAGTIRTPAWDSRLKYDQNVFEKLAKWYPLGRIGEPDNIGKAALFLASEDASWITGASLVVDGGLTAGNLHIINDLETKSFKQDR